MKLKIRLISRKRKGVIYHTWQLIKGGKVVNHQYNNKRSRDKQLAKHLEDIKSGNYEITE